jgi:hypothetical protein
MIRPHLYPISVSRMGVGQPLHRPALRFRETVALTHFHHYSRQPERKTPGLDNILADIHPLTFYRPTSLFLLGCIREWENAMEA